MDDKKCKRHAFENNIEMSETYISKRSNKTMNGISNQSSDEESFSNDIENQSRSLETGGNNNSELSKDITNSSVSMSEGEGDVDLEGLTGRVTELNELLQGKEAVIEALHAEYDHLGTDVSSPTSLHSQNSNIPNKDITETYCKKIQEFEQAINQRDNLIEELTSSLKQTIDDRDSLLAQIGILNSTQLGNSTTENDYRKVAVIRYVLDNKNKVKVNSKENNFDIFEINQLQKQCEEKVEKIKKEMKIIIDKFATETDTNNIKHENEIKELTIKHEIELKKVREENQNYFMEISNLKKQIITYKETTKSLKLKLINNKESHSKEKKLLNNKIHMYKLQYEDVAAKYVTTNSVLDSKESIERSIDKALNEAASFKAENKSLKLDNVVSKYSNPQNLMKNGQIQEKNLNNKIYSLEKSLSTHSGINLLDMDETTYKTIDEIPFQQKIIKKKLEEKTTLEKDLMKKVEDYEKLIAKMEDDKKAYEKQIKDLKNNYEQLTYKINSNFKIEELRLSDDGLNTKQMASSEFELINEPKKIIEKRDMEITDYIKKIDELIEVNLNLVKESNKLKDGLKKAYKECTVIEEKLDQTLNVSNRKLDCSTILWDESESFNSLENYLHTQSNHKLLTKLDLCLKQFEDYELEKIELIKKIETATNEKKQLLINAEQKEEEIKVFKMEAVIESQKFQKLVSNFEEREITFKQIISDTEIKHTQEMEELRKYFEKKCLQMEQHYSEEVFSLQSKKVLDNDIEIEDLSEDLYLTSSNIACLGGGGDALGILDKEEFLFLNNEHKKKNFEKKINKGKLTKDKEKLENLQSELEITEKSGYTALFTVVNQFSQTEQSCTVGLENNELNELRADYNRQLNEQLGLARIDILNALQERIEALISIESECDQHWPNELLELRNKFTNNAEKKLQSLKERHAQEIKRLKEGNNKIIYDLQEEIKRIKMETHESLQNNLIQERDVSHKICEILKDLISQLMTYFNECEEEMNNALISELLKKQLMNQSDNFPFQGEFTIENKRIHFSPHSYTITSIINNDNFQDLIYQDQDIKNTLKADLNACLQRFKADNVKILNMSHSDSESWSTGPSDNPVDKLMETEKLLICLQEENKHLKVKILNLQQCLMITENKKELISEAYGIQDESNRQESQEDFSELQERAKHVIMNGSNDTSYLIQLIDELYKHADKTLEDMKKEKEDLQHQIKAADKQLRSMRKFQEEQAVERENERDEAAKQIQQLQDRLREREREKNRDYHITSSESALSSVSSSAGNSTLQQVDESEINVSVEALTSQIRDMEIKKAETDNDLKFAITKIWELKKIIRNLDQEIKSKVDKEDILNNQIEHLKEIITSQTKNQEKLVQELEMVKSGNENNQLIDHIGHLQEELRKHQLSSEQLTANSSAVKNLRFEIYDMQTQLDRKTRDLETMHVCGSSLSLSQPSEDVSIREQIEATRCSTPDELLLPLVLPLDYALKLKEALLKHFRAEDGALKRLKELDIQLSNSQRQNEELLAEQEILQQTTSEQLFQIETLRARLEQQKQSAPFAHRQITSRLESQLFELNDKLESTERILAAKDIELCDIKEQLERMSRMLAEKENEITNIVQSESDIIQKLKNKLEIVEEERRMMKAKLNIQEKSKNNLPQLIDSILADKNEEIENLKEQVIQREKQLDIYLSLDEMNLREILQQNECQKNSARTLSDILSIKSDYETSEAIRETSNFTCLQNISNLKIPKSKVQSIDLQLKKDVIDFSQEIVETPRVPKLNLESLCYNSEGISSNTIEISKEVESLHMFFHEKVSLVKVSPTFESDTEIYDNSLKIQNNFICPRHDKIYKNNSLIVQQDTVAIQRIQELEIHLEEIQYELKNKSAILKQRDVELLEIQSNLKKLQENIESLNQDRLFYKAEYETSKKNENKIQKDLEEVENILQKKINELEDFKGKIKVNEFNLQEKLEEISNLKEIIITKDDFIEKLQVHNIEIEKEITDLHHRKIETYQHPMIQCQQKVKQLNDSINNHNKSILTLKDITKNNLSEGSIANEKDQEIYHLQEYLKEKDKVIQQMSDDSKSLQLALETIQSKMKESGNVVELRRKLKNEYENNIELTNEIAVLRNELEMLSSSRRIEEDNDIAEMVQRELNLSEKLDQQLLNVIDEESQKCGNLKQAEKEIDELNSFNDDLEIERDMLRSQIVEYENRIMQIKTEMEDKSMKIVRIEEELFKKNHVIKSLQLQFQMEKNASEEDKLKDTELISQLRIELDQALEIKERLLMEHKNIEVINTLEDQNRNVLSEKLKVEEHKNEEMQNTIKKLMDEKNRIQKHYETSKVEVKNLTTYKESDDLIKHQLKLDLQRIKEELKAKTKECSWHKSILKTMNDAEIKRDERRTNEYYKLKNLRRELKNAQQVMINLQADIKMLREQLSEAAERETQLTHCIESLTDKETELTENIIVMKKENKKLKNLLAEQEEEIKLFLNNDIDLTEDLKTNKSSLNKVVPCKTSYNIKDLNINIDKLFQDKICLYEKVNSLKEENKMYLNQIRILESKLSQRYQYTFSKSDLQEKMQYFYGKYLRLESRLKSLIYQKKYLLCVLTCYEHVEENVLATLAQLTDEQRRISRGDIYRQYNPRVRFRALCLFIIAIHRMKWLILRWKTGFRVGANVVLNNIEPQTFPQQTKSTNKEIIDHQ